MLIKYGPVLDATSDVLPFITEYNDKNAHKQLLQSGDVIIADTAEDEAVGKATEIINVGTRKVVSGLHTIACRPRVEMTPTYLGFYINSETYHQQLYSLMQGVKVLSISKSNIEGTTLCYPTEAEQQKICGLLNLIELRIVKQRQLIEHLKKYKRGVLKAILEQRLRFKRSNGENYPKWESYTISEITDCLDRRRVPITSNERIKGAYPYYGANGIQDYVADYIFDGEFVLLAEDGGHFNDFATEPIAQYVSGKIWVNNHAHILQAKCNTHFLFYALVHKDIRNYINNPSRGKLNQEDMQGIVIDVPCKEEQERIVDFMLKIDQNIEAKLNTLNQLVDFKKGLLQQLFI